MPAPCQALPPCLPRRHTAWQQCAGRTDPAPRGVSFPTAGGGFLEPAFPLERWSRTGPTLAQRDAAETSWKEQAFEASVAAGRSRPLMGYGVKLQDARLWKAKRAKT